MKYDRVLIKRAYNHKEQADEITKEIIERLIEAYNMCYGELRGANADMYELRERLKRSHAEQPVKRRRRRRKKQKEEEPKTITKSTFFGGN